MQNINHPKTSVSLDGSISIVVENGPLRPYEFRITKIAPVAGAPSAWTGSDTPNGRDKTYSGLSAGKYKIEVDTDNASGDPHTCVKTLFIDLIPTCEDLCGDGGAGGSCTNALEVAEKTGLTTTNLPEHVRFAHIPQYNIGEAEVTFEAWIKPATNNSNMIILSMDNGFPYFNTPPDTATAGDALQFLWGIIGTNRPLNGTDGVGVPVTSPYPTQGDSLTTGNPRTGLGNPYNNPNGAAFFVNFGKGTTNNLGASSILGIKLLTIPIESWDPDNFNHVALIIRDIPAPVNNGTTAIFTGLGAPRLGGDSAPSEVSKIFETTIEFWCNGVKISEAWDVQFDDSSMLNFPVCKSSVPADAISLRDEIRNFDNLTGAVKVFARASSYAGGGGTPSVSAPTSGDVTNLRWYKRALNGTEIQKNYMSGCHGEPYNCASLLLYAPLDQTSGKVTPERIYGNNGQLIGYAPNRTNTIGGTSAWIEACCPKIVAFDDYNCGAQDCNPDFVEFYVSLSGVDVADPGETIVAAFIPYIGTCPTPSTVASQANFETLSTLFELTGINSALELVDELVTAFNAVFTGTSIVAIDNLTTLIIRIPKSLAGSQDYCNQPFSLCLYSGTALVPATYTGNFTTSYPKGQMAICCVTPTDCGLNNDAPIMI
jgi:hypothetical protein